MTVICHFYNEEYLLPYWLAHHSKIFTNGIMIDYHSTDKSVEIFKEICPNWTIVTSKNEMFYAQGCDTEVREYEKEIDGYKIALNVTEFLIGDINKLISENNEQYIIPCYPMIDSLSTEFEELEYSYKDKPLVYQRLHGIDFAKSPTLFAIRKARSLHRVPVAYSTGRHFGTYNTTDAAILWYGYSPFTEGLIERKLQIQTRLPAEDRAKGFGVEHYVDRSQLINNFRYFQQFAEDLSEKLEPLIEKTYII